MNAHEAGLLGFLTERSQRRLRTLLELGPKRRGDVREFLNQLEFDSRWKSSLTGAAGSLSSMFGTLRAKGAPDECFVISNDKTLDGQQMPLEDAIELASGAFEGTFISCVPGKLGLYEGPGIKSACVLEK